MNDHLTFKQYLLCFESKLEDLNIRDDDNIEDLIEKLHEIEYKMSKILPKFWSMNSKFYKNLMIRFSKIGLKCYGKIIKSFNRTLNSWRDGHKISSGEEFAESRLKYLLDGYGEEDLLNHFNENGWFAGKREFQDPILMTKEEVLDNISDDVFYEVLSEEFEYLDYDGISSHFGSNAVDFLRVMNINLYDVDEVDGDGDAEWLDSIVYIFENNLDDKFKRYIVHNYFFSDVFPAFPLTLEMWKDAASTYLYDRYMDEFGPEIEEILNFISEHFKRANKINLSKIKKLIEDLENIPSESEEVRNVSYSIYKHGISQLTTIISLVMNIKHVHGKIMRDYALGDDDLTDNFLEHMNDRDTSDWDDELKSMIGG